MKDHLTCLTGRNSAAEASLCLEAEAAEEDLERHRSARGRCLDREAEAPLKRSSLADMATNKGLRRTDTGCMAQILIRRGPWLILLYESGSSRCPEDPDGDGDDREHGRVGLPMRDVS